MILSELWHHYEAEKRIQGFSPNTLRVYALQLKMLVVELGDVDNSESLEGILSEAIRSLKAKQPLHRIRFVRSLFRFAYEDTYLSSNPSIKLREPKMETSSCPKTRKRTYLLPKFLLLLDMQKS